MVPVHQRLIEALHAVWHRAFLDQLRNVERFGHVADLLPHRFGVHKNLDRGHTPFLVGPAHEAHRDDRAQRVGEHVPHLCLLVRRVERQNTVDRLGRIRGVQRREDEVAGFRGLERRVEGVEVPNLADEQDVRVLSEHAPQRLAKAVGVGSDFALVDAALDVAVQELDGVFDRDDVRVPVLIDVVEHRRERRRFSGARDSSDENQAARHQCDPFAHLGQIELSDRLRLERHGSHRVGDGSALLVGVDAEASDTWDGEREVRFLLLRKFLDVLGRHDLLGQAAQIILRQRRHIQRHHVTVYAQCRRTPDFQVHVGGALLNHVLQNGLVVEASRATRRNGGWAASGGRAFGRGFRASGSAFRHRFQFIRHWDLCGGGPARIRPDARSARESLSPLRRIRTRSRS